MKDKDIRWAQRFSNYNKALQKLTEAIEYIQAASNKTENKNIDTTLDDIIKEGLIQRFEYTHELTWNVIKDFLEEKGTTKLYGSRDVTREAFKAELITDGDIWMDMINSRNKTSHTYNEETANEIFTKIISEYYPAFIAFQKTMKKLAD